MEPIRFRKSKSITFRMTFVVCAFFLGFQVLLSALTYHHFKKELKESISSQQFTLLNALAASIDEKLSSTLKVIVNVGKSVTPKDLGSPEAAQAFLDVRTGTHAIFDNGLFLISPEGRLIAESPFRPDRRGRDLSFREFYLKSVATGRPFISEPYVSTHTPGALAVMFTTPVTDAGGNLVAILGGSVNLNRNDILGALPNITIAKSGYVFIVSRSRQIILHPDKSHPLAHL